MIMNVLFVLSCFSYTLTLYLFFLCLWFLLKWRTDGRVDVSLEAMFHAFLIF